MLLVTLLIALASGASAQELNVDTILSSINHRLDTLFSFSALSRSERLCACPLGSRLTEDSGSQCEPLLLNDPCITDDQCQVNNGHSVCLFGACSCEQGFYNNKGECRRTASLEGPCAYDGDCFTGSYNGTCVDGTCSCPTTSEGDFEYRLTGGSGCNMGRVEVRKNGGPWQFVCDDSWDSRDANVLCRSLGFERGAASCCSEFPGSDNFIMDNVECGGSESHLGACSHQTDENCGENEVAGVICA